MEERFDESTANLHGSEHEAMVLRRICPLLRIPHAVVSLQCWGGLVAGAPAAWWGHGAGLPAPLPLRLVPHTLLSPDWGCLWSAGTSRYPGMVMHRVGIAAACSFLGWGLHSEVV